eukprot:TRINITY_DN7055_c0_g1_i1.p1 TRINITY_DN7055_c0_g1~~TRINITY_DN7055_c0_g1_i1.p1  ORF type:complete len:297 (-),score=42.52 TRINITY_DN7055_c0_g1_i1:56-853(-)
MEESWVCAIDQGTSSSRVILFDQKGQAKFSHQVEFDSVLPHPGWVEQDPMVLLATVQEGLKEIGEQHSGSLNKIKAIGITNQRETTIVWDKITGKPLHNALVWLDTRTSGVVNDLIKKHDKDFFRKSCGLPISTYFSAMKLKWLIHHVPDVKKAIDDGRCLFGTVDTWLIWNLTGGKQGGVHVTDVTNASRTMLMDLETLNWSQNTCEQLQIPRAILPEIRSSSEIYGKVADGVLKGVPISGCLGDQQAALVGQSCFNKGDVKNT